jgi:hypothetical protein
MRVKSELQPGQAASGHKLTISEVLAEYLRAERGRLAPKTYAQYTEVIALFTQSLNGCAANSLRNLPAAEKLSALLYDLTAGRREPHDSDIEGRFSITKVEPGRIWLQDDDDGKDYGPILLPEKQPNFVV